MFKMFLYYKYCVFKFMDFASKFSFRRVIVDGDAGDDVMCYENILFKLNGEIKCVILCMGKIYYLFVR